MNKLFLASGIIQSSQSAAASAETVMSFSHIKDLLSSNAMFGVGVLLIAGYIISKLVAFLKLPSVTGYIIAGLLLGESVTGIFPVHMSESFAIVTEIALGLIALTIGGEFYWSKLKRTGKGIVIITLVQLVLSFGFVTIGLLLFEMELPFALLLGAIASATAPAATVAIVQSLRAHGVFIDHLYGVVALDDAGCVILFGLIFSFASGFLVSTGEAMSAGAQIMSAVMEVVWSVGIGALSGFLLHYVTRRKSSTNEMLIMTLGIVFTTTAVAIVFHLSPLLTNMAAGAALINLSPRNHRLFRFVEPLTPPVYALFFVLAGTELQPHIILQKEVLVLGSVYIFSRALGKYGGVFLGSIIAGVDIKIKKYLGFCMLPQAGVAIGLVLLIQSSPLLAHLDDVHVRIIDTMVNIVLLSVFVNELIGPPLSKYAIIKGNEMEE